MFGLFKKKKAERDALFEKALAMFATDFAPVIGAIDDKGSAEIIDRALTNYYARDPGEANYSAADFYFDAFTGAMFELTENGTFPPQVSLRFFAMTDSFLRGHGLYQTPVVLDLMDKWQSMLIDMGAIKISPTGTVE